MVYNWDDKEAECFRIYVQEKKSLDEVVEYWEQRGFTPSKRAFQTQFKRWNFPSKHNPAHRNPDLIARIKELWEKNYTQKDMVDTLQAEGHDINDRELMRVRVRFKWFLREARGSTSKKRKPERAKNPKTKKPKPKPKKTKIVPGHDLINQLGSAILQETSSEEEESEESEIQSEEENEDAPHGSEAEGDADAEVATQPAEEAVLLQQQTLDPEEILRRQLRVQQLQLESDEKWRTRKRRRRTRGWAGLPADAPGEPPRFPSETTIDESKAYLSLDNNLYRQMRDQFQAICEEEGVVKKTIAGPEKWAQLLQRLIRENSHLADTFRDESESLRQADAMWRPKNYKCLSLDVICQDVTKRMRVLDTRMSLPEAKNILGLNPAQTREVRAAFLAILRADHFTSRVEAGDEHFKALKQRWIQESEHLRHVVVPEGEQIDPQRAKAIEVLARDVMKRFRASKDTAPKQKQAHQGPGPGPAAPSVPGGVTSVLKRQQKKSTSSNPPLPQQSNTNIAAISADTEFEIDPSLLLAASDASIFPPQHEQHQVVAQNQHTNHEALDQRAPTNFNNSSSYSVHTHNTTYSPNPHQQSTLHPSCPLPIYFRLHSLSETSMPNKTVWLSILQKGNLAEVKNLAMREHPGTVLVRLEGLIMHRGDGMEREVPIAIDDDGELHAFLQHVAGGKATFLVLLAPSGNGGYM